VLEAVSRRGSALEHAQAQVRANKQVVLAAVSNCGRALEHASHDLKADREVVLAALHQGGSSCLCHVAPELRDDVFVIFAAANAKEAECRLNVGTNVGTFIMGDTRDLWTAGASSYVLHEAISLTSSYPSREGGFW